MEQAAGQDKAFVKEVQLQALHDALYISAFQQFDEIATMGTFVCLVYLFDVHTCMYACACQRKCAVLGEFGIALLKFLRSCTHCPLTVFVSPVDGNRALIACFVLQHGLGCNISISCFACMCINAHI